MNLDMNTGLPQAPEGHFWRIRRNPWSEIFIAHNGSMYPEDPDTMYLYDRVRPVPKPVASGAGPVKKPTHYLSLVKQVPVRKRRWWGRGGPPLENVMLATGVYEEDANPAGFYKAAEGLLADYDQKIVRDRERKIEEVQRQIRNERLNAWVGDYPPNSLLEDARWEEPKPAPARKGLSGYYHLGVIGLLLGIVLGIAFLTLGDAEGWTGDNIAGMVCAFVMVVGGGFLMLTEEREE